MHCQGLVSASGILQRKEKGSDWDLPSQETKYWRIIGLRFSDQDFGKEKFRWSNLR
jgi:hypothetical protein